MARRLVFDIGEEVTAPPAGSCAIFADSDGVLKRLNSDATELPFLIGDTGIYPLVDSYAVVNDGPAMQEAIDSIASHGGGEMRIPPGEHRLKSTVTLEEAPGVVVEGGRPTRARVFIDDSDGNIGPGFLLKNGHNCAVRNLTMTTPSGQRTAGHAIHIVGGDPDIPLDTYPLMDSGTTVENVDMIRQFNGVVIENDEDNDYRNLRTTIRGGRHRLISAGGVGVWVNTCVAAAKFGASQFIREMWIGDSPAAALAGIRLTGTGDCTLTDNEVYGSYPGGQQHALLIDPVSGGFLTSITVKGGFYDRSDLACIKITPHASVSKFGGVRFIGVWAAGSTTGHVLHIGGAAAKHIRLVGCELFSAEGTPGWCAVVDAASHVDFTATSFAGAVTGGILFTGSASNFSVGGQCRFTGAGVGTGLTTLPIGIQIDAGCDRYGIDDSDLSDSAIATKITNTPGASANRRVIGPGLITL